MKQKTLEVRLPLGRTLVLAVALILFAFLIAEGFIRISSMRSLLPTPSIGSENALFESAIDGLDKTQEQFGQIDCIFVGSSVVRMGIDVAAFEEGYRAKSSQAIHCAKAYLPGLTTPFAGDFSEFLVKVYRPRLIVYGSNVRDYRGYADASSDPMIKEIVGTPWYQYREGRFDLQGWLVDHSVAFRYYLIGRNWMRLPVVTDKSPVIDVTQPLQPDKEGDQIRGFSRFEVTTAVMSSVDKLATINNKNTQVLMVQIPLHPSFILYLPHGQQDFDRAVARVEREAQAHQLLYWRAENLPPLPDDLWADRIHLRFKGAAIYSKWLGERIAEGVLRGVIQDPTRATAMEK